MIKCIAPFLFDMQGVLPLTFWRRFVWPPQLVFAWGSLQQLRLRLGVGRSLLQVDVRSLAGATYGTSRQHQRH
jgi:hypothetical protein